MSSEEQPVRRIRPGETYWMGYRNTANETFFVKQITIYEIDSTIWSDDPNGNTGYYWTPRQFVPRVGPGFEVGSYQVFFDTRAELIAFMRDVWLPRATEKLTSDLHMLESQANIIRRRLEAGITWTEE